MGAWFNFPENGTVLDIGTGTGLIALMAAQRGAGSVVAVEIDEKAAAQAAANAALSKWKDIVTVVHSDIACFSDDKRFDAVVCNPPFFRDSLRSPDSVRSQARHNDTLSYEKLAEVVSCLLSNDGLFSLVLPYDMGDTFISVAAKNGLYLCKRTNVVTRKGNLPKRVLLSLSKQVKVCVTDELVMFDELNNETSEYIYLVRDFYLKY